MLTWCSANGGTLLVLAILLAIIAAILRSMMRDRRQGKHACGGDCSACGGCAGCRRDH